MYKKILVPLDGSKRAEQILPHIVALSYLHGAEIILLHIAVDPFYDTILTGPKLAQATHEVIEAIRPAAQFYLEELAAELEANGLIVKTEVCEGITSTGILDCAKQVQADLIALSAHGRGGLNEMPLGAITEEIIHRAHVPVLLIPVVENTEEEMNPHAHAFA
jgi:nucleotide-binding universal stress UspA family protein